MAVFSVFCWYDSGQRDAIAPKPPKADVPPVGN